MKAPDLSGLTHYLNETLGISVTPKPLGSASRLAYFLQNSYALFETGILDNACILAVDLSGQEPSPAIVRKHMDQIRAKYGGEAVYIRKQVTAYNRKRLIEHKVQFIVPGNQMYLPLLGIDLREHFKKQRLQPVKLNPSTQAVVIYLCIKNTKEVVTPARIAKQLGYSAMTLTRAFDELEGIGVGDFFNQGRERCLRCTGDKKVFWENALPFLRSPVKRRFYIRTDDKKHPGPLSGLSALAHYSILAEPNNSSVGLSGVEWKKYSQSHKISLLTFPEPDAYEIEIWAYAPTLFSKEGVIDRLSLYLSLKDNHDERIESAMDRMMKDMEW